MAIENLELRDWFAGQALLGLLTAKRDQAPPPSIGMTSAVLAKEAYELAAAMVAEKRQRKMKEDR